MICLAISIEYRRDRQTDRQTDRLTSYDGIDHAMHSIMQ